MSIPLTSGVHHDARPHNIRSLNGVIVQLESLLLGLYGRCISDTPVIIVMWLKGESVIRRIWSVECVWFLSVLHVLL